MAKKQKNHRLLHILIALAALSLLFLPLFFKVGFQEFQSLGLLGIFLINLIGSATIFFPAPAFLSVGVGGNLYNPIMVALIGALGSSIGEAVGYVFGFSSKKIITYEKNHHFLFAFFRFLFKKYGDFMVLFFSFLPNPVFDGIGIFAGASEYSIKRFMVLTFIGRFARYIIIAYVGYVL